MPEAHRSREPERADCAQQIIGKSAPITCPAFCGPGVTVRPVGDREAAEPVPKVAYERLEDAAVQAGGVRYQQRLTRAAQVVRDDLGPVTGSDENGRAIRHPGKLAGVPPALPFTASRQHVVETPAVQSFLESWGYLALVVLTFAEAACIPIPSEITLGFAGYLAYEHKLEIVLVILLATLGELAGSFVGWGIGRYGGRPLIDRLGKYVLLTKTDLDRAHRWFERRGEPAVVLGRVLPIIRTFISLPAGVAEMSPVRFGIATAGGSLVWCAALSIAGYELGSKWHELTKGFSDAGYLLAALAVVAIAAFIGHRYLAVRREREQKSPA